MREARCLVSHVPNITTAQHHHSIQDFRFWRTDRRIMNAAFLTVHIANLNERIFLTTNHSTLSGISKVPGQPPANKGQPHAPVPTTTVRPVQIRGMRRHRTVLISNPFYDFPSGQT